MQSSIINNKGFTATVCYCKVAMHVWLAGFICTLTLKHSQLVFNQGMTSALTLGTARQLLGDIRCVGLFEYG